MMGAYHQMGHDSTNLLSEPYLNMFRGAILSPVNCDKSQIISIIQDPNFTQMEMVFDPQLYFPNSNRGELPRWDYFPSDVDTADVSSIKWWQSTNKGLMKTLRRIKPNAVCSPAVVPRVYDGDYYSLNRDVADDLRNQLSNTSIQVLQTLIVRLSDLSARSRAEEIASIASASGIPRIFLVLYSDLDPRLELNKSDELRGAIRLIRFLEQSGICVLMGFVSSDVILWKAAGATNCATGKFFNIRRFTPSRFSEPPEGGGQISHWFEESMMAYIRESDLIRIRDANLLSVASSNNPFCQQILAQLENNPGKAWLGISWRQYLYWFADFENRYCLGQIDANNFLQSVENVWRNLEDNQILMEEPRNDGYWIRQWRRAIVEAFR